MAYKLEIPYSEEDKLNFIVTYNHQQSLKLEMLDDGTLFALKPNEILVDGKVSINPKYAQELAEQRENAFKKEFFETSLGWIRRQVNMKDGSKKDFLSDLLLQIKAGLELGQNVEIITYKQPDFSKDINEAYVKTLQEKKSATVDFVKECLMRTVCDFNGD